MDFFDFLRMIGAIALFLYGMEVMSTGLLVLSGGKIQRILEKTTSKKPAAVLVGAVVTAIIQSSSATTVMIVSLVNSGIMSLHQATGVIYGANVGTTVTSWLLSLVGIESDNFFVSLLKPSSFSPVIAMAGVLLILLSKNRKKKEIGAIFAGFAVLMFGMNEMTEAVSKLADADSFKNIFIEFSNPVLAMTAGFVVTALIQSSSVSVGMLQALSITGSVSYAVAIPVIMGQNIGTCITAIISGIGAGKDAKRVAIIHLYFNLIGTILFMVVFYAANMFIQFEFMDSDAGITGIAFIHTLFNIGSAIVLYPFIGVLEKMAVLTVK